MDSLSRTLNGFMAPRPQPRRPAPTSRLVAIMPDGEEREITRGKNCGRTIYSCGPMSSSRLGDLAAGLGARVEQR